MGQFHNNSYQTLTPSSMSYSNSYNNGNSNSLSIFSWVIIGILMLGVLVFIVYFVRVLGKQDNTPNNKVEPE